METVKCQICYETFESELPISNYLFGDTVMCNECFNYILDKQLK